MKTLPLQVAVGVIENECGRVLISKRPDHVHQGGLWEFPGGKVETNETVQQTLQRELHEELGIEIAEAEPLIKIHHHYPTREVLLDVWRVKRFSGEPSGCEGQPLQWVTRKQLPAIEFPEANWPIVKAICLPDRYAILEGSSEDEVLANLHTLIAQRIELMQLRLKNLLAPVSTHLLQTVVDLCQQQGITVLKNSALSSSNIDDRVGLHLTANDLARYQRRPASQSWVAASCHNQQELTLAEKLGVDFVVLAPVQPTRTHPGAEALGWEAFSQLAMLTHLPVFALGGLKLSDLQQAKFAGAQGIAGITTFLES